MKIGIVSGAGFCIPLLYQLKAIGAEVQLYFGDVPHPDKDREGVLPFCTSQKITVTRETRKSDLYSWLDRFAPDAVFVCGYAHKISVKKCGSVRHGLYNIHYGKLPFYRGPNPVFWQLKNGEPTPGLCIHAVTDRFDAGPVVWQQELRSEPHFNHSLINQLFGNLQVQGVFFVLNQLANGQPLPTVKQDEKKAAYQARPTLKDVTIHWQSMPAKQIIDLVKACNTWNYGAITAFDGQEVKILDVAAGQRNGTAGSPGTLTQTASGIAVACCDGKWLDVGFLSINGILFHPRHAAAYGIGEGRRFTT